MRIRLMALCLAVAMQAALPAVGAEQKGKGGKAKLTPQGNPPPPQALNEVVGHTGTVDSLTIMENEAWFTLHGDGHVFSVIFPLAGHEGWLESVKHALRSRKKNRVNMTTKPDHRGPNTFFRLVEIYERP